MKAPHMPPTEDPGLVASTHKGGGLDRDALALGKQLYEAFWQRQPVGAAAPDFDGQAAAIRDMWSGIAGDALSLISAARKGQREWREGPFESVYPADDRRVLLLASYCGDDNPKCSDERPCNDCLSMNNVALARGQIKVLGGLDYVATLPPPPELGE